MVKSAVNSIFGHRLREARRRAGIPQDRLGVLIGLDEHSASARMSRYETGVHEPPFDIALRLAEVLSLPVAYFYCTDDDLADILMIWGRLSKSERIELKVNVEEKYL